MTFLTDAWCWTHPIQKHVVLRWRSDRRRSPIWLKRLKRPLFPDRRAAVSHATGEPLRVWDRSVLTSRAFFELHHLSISSVVILKQQSHQFLNFLSFTFLGSKKITRRLTYRNGFIDVDEPSAFGKRARSVPERRSFSQEPTGSELEREKDAVQTLSAWG